MNAQVVKKEDAVPRLQLFNCAYTDCGATFTRQWRLLEHETVHTGAVSPNLCFFFVFFKIKDRVYQILFSVFDQTFFFSLFPLATSQVCCSRVWTQFHP